MGVLYDTGTVHPLDRFEYYVQAGAGAELAPVEISGQAPRRLHAVMSATRIGDFTIEALDWTADSEIIARRTDRLIRACDPDCLRIFLSVNAGVRAEQAGSRVMFGARDIALYDLSCPWRATHPAGQVSMQTVMLTFPRALVSATRAAIWPLAGTLMPRNLPGRSLIARFLIGLAGTTAAGGQADPDLAGTLRECVTALIRERLGQPDGITPRTRQLLHTAFIRAVIGQHLADPALSPAKIAEAASISPRYLHKLFQDTRHTPMQLVKQLRLEACQRSLADPALAMMPIKDIISACGYRRPDQFARDFKQLFGIPPRQSRASHQPGPPRLAKGLPGRVFISYVRQDAHHVDLLHQALQSAGVHVWRDSADLWPGEDWHAKIRHEITNNALVFVACFSRQSLASKASYQNAELSLAADQMRLRSPGRPWLIPVRFDDCEIPDLNIGGGRTLAALQRANLFGARRDEETSRLVESVKRILADEPGNQTLR